MGLGAFAGKERYFKDRIPGLQSGGLAVTKALHHGTNERQQGEARNPTFRGSFLPNFMSKPILILYGSVTGNSEYCAEKAARVARERGYDPTVESLAATEPEVLEQFDTALIVTSTYGDGEPPDGTEDFYEAVVNAKRLTLPNLRFSVLSLGDSSYDQFCKCGKDYDSALEAMGGTRLHARVDCDTDYDDPCDEWIAGVFTALAEDRLLAA